jgi:hypothetical protein
MNGKLQKADFTLVGYSPQASSKKIIPFPHYPLDYIGKIYATISLFSTF